jgi:hypothetical protein
MLVDDQSMMDIEASLLNIEAMLRQEESGYTVPDYLRHLPAHTAFGQPIDAAARFSIAEWCVKIMEFCHYKRETAAIAMSCLDRFASTPDGHQVLLDRRKFQLAALTSVYTAVKIHEQQALAPQLVAKLSHGFHTVTDIEAMERRMLQALRWRVNPPTSMEFVRKILDLIPQDVMDEKSRKVAVELVQYQVDLSVVNYGLCTKKASCIAFASLLNAVERVHNDGVTSIYVESVIAHSANINSHSFQDLRDQLYEAISTQSVSKMMETQVTRKSSFRASPYSSSSERSYSNSPRSVHESQ